MVVRTRKRKNKLRGNRTHGKGDTKNRRGAGVIGGKGRAGSHKHKFSKYYLTFGTKSRLAPKNVEKAINLDDLNILIDNFQKSKNKLDERQGKIIVDGKKINYDKILSRGNLNHSVVFTNLSLSKKALEKVEATGSVVEQQALEQEKNKEK